MIEKPANTSVEIHELLARRWSPRAIDQQRPVSRRDLTALLEAARWAPSCFGDQPWRYLVLDRFRDRDAWQAGWDCLTAGNRAWVREAPVLLVSFADSVFRKNGKPNRWGQHDTGAASENLCLQGTALGLVVHQMGGFDRDKIRQAFDVPERFTAMAMIAIGHPGDPADLPEEKRAAEIAARSRVPLAEIAFETRWDSGFGL